MLTENIFAGFWTDYDRSQINRNQIILSDFWMGVITNALAIMITSTTGPFFNLVIRPLNRFRRWLFSLWSNVPPETMVNSTNYGESFELIVRNDPEGNVVNISLRPPRRRYTPMDAIGIGFMLMIVGLVPVSLIVASILSAGIATDTIALSRSNDCGIYNYNFDASKSGGKFLEYEYKAESQARNYAETCYGPSSIPDDCIRYYKQNISYSLRYPVECPFDGNVCHGGRKNSIEMDTGLVSGSLLGINAPNPYSFQRTSTCSPLITNQEYVRSGISPRGVKQWEYWYGKSLAKYTWANPVDEGSWDIKGYTASVHCSFRNSPFQPNSEFTVGPYPVTLIFISSHSILYSESRNDPIFPAEDKVIFIPGRPGSSPPTYYHYNSTRAGVLACVDRFKICRNHQGPCWTNGNISSIPIARKGQDATTEESVVGLILQALKFSSSCGSIQFQGAQALEAQSKIGGTQSLRLAPQQWQVEAEKLFRTSLARMQLNVFDLVRGTASKFEGYENVMPQSYRRMCGMVKIPTRGWKNLNTWGTFGIPAAVGFIWAIGWRREVPNEGKVLVLILGWRRLLPVRRAVAIYTRFAWEKSEPVRTSIERLITGIFEYGKNVLEGILDG